MVADPAVQHRFPLLERLLPERRVEHPGGRLVASPGVVDQEVETPRLLLDPGEEAGDVSGVGVVAAHRDAAPALARDLLGRVLDAPGHPRKARELDDARVARRGLGPGAPSGDVDGGPGRAELDRDSLARSPAGAR